MKINMIKVDCRPNLCKCDLDLGAVRRKFQLDGVNRCIFKKHYTLRYTSSLHLQFFIRHQFLDTLNKIPRIVKEIKTNFNKYKRTKVSYFRSMTITNMQCSGRSDYSRDELVRHFAPLYRLYVSSHVQDNFPVPLVSNAMPPSAQILTVKKGVSSIIKFNLVTDTYTLVARSVDDFIDMVENLKRLAE